MLFFGLFGFFLFVDSSVVVFGWVCLGFGAGFGLVLLGLMGCGRSLLWGFGFWGGLLVRVFLLGFVGG